MAVEKRKYTNRTTYRAYWRNPWTGKIEKGPSRDTLKEARKDDAEVKIRLEFDFDSFRPVDMPKPGQGRTLAELSEIYLSRSDLAPSTRKMEYYHFKIILGHMGHMEAEDMNKEDLKEFENLQRKSGIKQNTIQRRISSLRAVLNWSAENGLIKENPVQGYRCKRGQDAKLPPPSPAETRAMLKYAPPHLLRAVIIGYYFGVRVGESELLKLKWLDFDKERRRFRIWSAQKNKNQPWRDVDITDALFPILLQWEIEDNAAGQPYVIHYRGKPIKSFKRAWKTCKEKAGITRRIRPYDLRHAFATEAIAAGADLKAVADLMGHADTKMIHHHYQHVVDEQKRKVVESIPDVLDGVQHRGTKGTLSGDFSYPDNFFLQ